MRIARECARGRQRNGFTLIEVLVTLVIISMGILGTTGLMLKAMVYAKTSSLRTVAALQATSLASAMYANRSYWADASLSPCFSTSGGGKQGCTYLTIPLSAVECSPCTAKARAIADLGAWRDSVQAALPQAKVDVTCLGAAAGGAKPQSCDIRLVWNEHFIDLRQQGSLAALVSAATSGLRTYVLHVIP